MCSYPLINSCSSQMTATFLKLTVVSSPPLPSQQLRASLQSELPPEPEDTDSANVTVMRFRHPASDQFTRAFKLDTTLQVLEAWTVGVRFPDLDTCWHYLVVNRSPLARSGSASRVI